MKSKLINELPNLVENDIISQEIAAKIEQFYVSKEQNAPNKLFLVFGVLGSLLVGLGIILILAHNWDHFSKITKTILAFLPLVIGQLFVGYSILKKKSKVWKEASGTFLFFAVGASIALISQIYNIPGNLSSYLLTWVVLCLPLIYLLKSNTLWILNLIFITYYACEYGYSFRPENLSPWLYLVLLGAIMPHYIQLLRDNAKSNITSVFNWLIPLSMTIVLGAFVEQNYSIGLLLYLLFFGFCYNIGKIPFFDNQKLRRNGFLIFGSLGSIIILLWTSFQFVWEDVVRHEMYFSPEFYLVVTLFLVTSAILVYSYKKHWIKGFNLFQYVFVIFTALFFMGFNSDMISTILINVLILALGLTTIKIGADKFHFGVLNYGLIIITALVICRFFDTNISFVLRGVLFVSVGFGFFITNYYMLKKQKTKDNLLKK